jgi:hypothetical protein
METFFLILLALVVARFFWREFLVVTCLVVLAVACSRADTITVALVSDGTVPVESMRDAAEQVDRIYSQLGTHVVVTSAEVYSNVPTHTNPNALLQDFRTQVSAGTQQPTATILFTARTLNVGGGLYAGIATTGPACTAWQVAVISTQEAGGPVANTLAHELGHTLGLEHDDGPGYVMGPDERGGDTFSPQSIAQYKGQFRDCLADPVVAQAQAPVAKSTPVASKGGGGEMGETFIMFLAIAAAVREYFRGMKARESAHYWANKYRQLKHAEG